VKLFLQAEDECVVINGDISVTVLRIEGDEVVLGVEAPQWVAIEERPALYCEAVREVAPLPAR
jgi:carbon storage regulator CsrA